MDEDGGVCEELIEVMTSGSPSGLVVLSAGPVDCSDVGCPRFVLREDVQRRYDVVIACSNNWPRDVSRVDEYPVDIPNELLASYRYVDDACCAPVSSMLEFTLVGSEPD